MKLHFPTRLGIALAAPCGIVLALGVFAFRVQADDWDKKTVLTVDQPIQIQDTYLEPGTYVFKLIDSNSDRHIVQIFNRDQDHLINTIIAMPNYRLQPTGGSRFTFYETPPGTARALHAWFYPGDNFGQEFRYPKQRRQLVTATQATPAPVVARTSEPPAATIVTESAPTQEAVTEQPKREEPVLIAQDTTPPASQDTQATEQPNPEAPAQLPQTASPFPLVGLIGLVSLAGSILLRTKSAT